MLNKLFGWLVYPFIAIGIWIANIRKKCCKSNKGIRKDEANAD